ncbi:hypothetical protein RB595_008087 [Gaeumannomyces hyphopodioides]
MSHIQRIKVINGKAVNLWSDKPTEIVPGLFLSTLRTKDNEQLCRERNIVARVAIYRQGDVVPWSFTCNGHPRRVSQTEESSSTLLCIPLYDHWSSNLLDHFPSICRFISQHADVPSLDELTSKPGADDAEAATEDAESGDGRRTSKQPRAVLVHCVMGISRSATAVAAFLMHKYGMSRDLALEHISKRRPQIYPKANFGEQLLDWQEKMRRRESGEPKPDRAVECRKNEALDTFEDDFEHDLWDNFEDEGVFPLEL